MVMLNDLDRDWIVIDVIDPSRNWGSAPRGRARR